MQEVRVIGMGAVSALGAGLSATAEQLLPLCDVVALSLPETVESVGLFDEVEIYMPEDDDTEVIRVVTTVRCDPRKGLISRESPFGKQVLGKKVGDRFTVQVDEHYSYEAEIRSIKKSKDDGSIPLLGY